MDDRQPAVVYGIVNMDGVVVVVDPRYSIRSTSFLGSVCLLSFPCFNVDTGVGLNDMHWGFEVVCTDEHKTQAALLDNILRHET